MSYGCGPGHRNGIILPKIPPKDTEIANTGLRTNYFAEEGSETKGEGAGKRNLSQALAVRGKFEKEKPTFYLRKKKNTCSLCSVEIPCTLLSPREQSHCQAGAAGVSEAGGAGCELRSAAGPGRAAAPQDLGKQVPDFLPRTAVTTGDMSLAEDIFQSPSPQSLSSGRCLPAARDSRPSPPHAARLPAFRLPLPAKPPLTDQAPLPGAPRREQGRAAAGPSPRATAGSGAGTPGGRAPAARPPRRLSRDPPAPPGCSRPPAAQQGVSSQCQACVFVV